MISFIKKQKKKEDNLEKARLSQQKYVGLLMASSKLIQKDGYTVWNRCILYMCLAHWLFVIGFSSGRGGIYWTYF